MQDTKLTFIEHLEELRNRIIKSLIVVVGISCVVYSFSESILRVLAQPIGSLVFIEPTEAFVTHIKIALFGGFFLSSPFVIYQVWQFVSVGLQLNERKYVSIFGPLSLLFFIIGSAFGYCIIVPIGLKFLLSFATDFMRPMITTSRYVSFVGMLVLAFGLVFELPLVSLFLTKIGMVTPIFLKQKRRHAIVLIFVIAAALTPPDVITQCLMAVPLIVLYEIGIIFSKIAYKPI